MSGSSADQVWVQICLCFGSQENLFVFCKLICRFGDRKVHVQVIAPQLASVARDSPKYVSLSGTVTTSMSDFKDQCSVLVFVAAAGSFTAACKEPCPLSYAQRSSISQLHAGVPSYRHLGPQFHSSLTSLYEKPTFWYRTGRTKCHRLWCPKERGPQPLSYGLYLSVQLPCGTAPVHM